MPPIRLDARDLLEHNARYGVLICRECRYAIQKSALRSHLLRHKIFRGERQRLLSSIAQLDLLEPHHVPLPDPTSPPIDGLPISSGYCCTATGCAHLCATAKRMRRHWSECHDLKETSPNSSSFARPVTLQTFFRGTKLRYFEVAVPPVVNTAGGIPLVTNTGDGGESRHDEQNCGEDGPIEPRVSAPPKTSPTVSPIGADLEMLTYFHHFTTTTSLTLPGAEHPQSATHYWQVNVVHQALQRQWLMCGLLAISAGHLAALADETTIKQVHCVRFAQFLRTFSIGLEETERGLDAVSTVAKEAKKAGGQIMCVLRCAYWVLAGSMLDQGTLTGLAAPLHIQSILTTIRGFSTPDLLLSAAGTLSDGAERQEATFTQAMRVLEEVRGTSETGHAGDASPLNNTASALFNRTLTLPYRMAETFGKPESAEDVLATLSAIAALVECSYISFSPSGVGGAWLGMVTWLNKVPEHFIYLVGSHNLAALVVLAHWAAFLVKRAEHCGCWFLSGLTKSILLQIAERLPPDNHAVQSLVEDLIA
ncbi:hypothetical protein BP5796_12448 [Coleophoma crateriformis]|uniref:C2H2-type domain-containing protein n=1 Tax=Coleophoma crateriformis TaxID=565419 RepID=A0A3D8QA79_9HELO|nr:hypothetical protein BP5796_12448 [Coleophoma crateriformis]